MLMKNIKHIYFDVGGVLLKDFSNTNKWVEMRRDLGVTEDQDKIFTKVWDKYSTRICPNFDIDETIPFYEEALGFNFPDNYSMLVDFVDRFELNKSIWSVIKKLMENYKVGLLTNMYPRMLTLINERNLIPDVKWDVVVDSSVVGYQKPDDAIYEIAERMSGVDGDEI